MKSMITSYCNSEKEFVYFVYNVACSVFVRVRRRKLIAKEDFNEVA